MGRLILDEFTDLPLDRKRKWLLRLKRDDPERFYAYKHKADLKYYNKNQEYRSNQMNQNRIKKIIYN